MISISKLWGVNKFSNLTNISKLLYIYLATSPSINYLGVVSTTSDEVIKKLSLSLDDLRNSSKELVDSGYLYVKSDGNDLYWIIPAHFSTVGNADSTIEKIRSDSKTLPKNIVNFLESIGISASKKKKQFEKPTPQEITDYCLSIGYIVDGQVFYDFYQNNIKSNDLFWYDGRGKLLVDWKAKARKVWCKEDRKIPKVKNAPKGLETYHIVEDNKMVFPTEWKDGKPFHPDFLIKKKLIKDYERTIYTL